MKQERLSSTILETLSSTIQIFQKHLSSTILEIELITKIHRRKPTGSVTESTKSNGEKKPLIFSGEGEEEERRFSGLTHRRRVAPFISSISILGFGETIFRDFRFIGSSLQLQQIFSYLLLMRFARLYEIEGTMQPDPRLPFRLFATDRFPINKLNIYSSPEILPFLRHVLRDTKEFQTI
ncbi:hypothetical protein HID58_059224 [Brassica napus]|uniref:Uncharacterized protein n=1 Tax=Brassica napus TaxID=3708 RepID=A0ABQ7ZSD3_BRANA|nr:hypothetical protein HID58_059224 [Brassica napus]